MSHVLPAMVAAAASRMELTWGAWLHHLRLQRILWPLLCERRKGQGSLTYSERGLQEGAEDAKGAPEVAGRKPQRFIPFSIGARDCVGQTLARLNLTTTLAQLYGSFTFKLAAEVRCIHSILHARSTACSSWRGQSGSWELAFWCMHQNAQIVDAAEVNVAECSGRPLHRPALCGAADGRA